MLSRLFIPSDGVSEEGQPGPPQTGSCVHTWDAEGPSCVESFVFLAAGADGQLMDSCDHCDGSAGTIFNHDLAGRSTSHGCFFFCLCTFKDFPVTHSGCSDDRKLRKERKSCVSYFRDTVKEWI